MSHLPGPAGGTYTSQDQQEGQQGTPRRDSRVHLGGTAGAEEEKSRDEERQQEKESRDGKKSREEAGIPQEEYCIPHSTSSYPHSVLPWVHLHAPVLTVPAATCTPVTACGVYITWALTSWFTLGGCPWASLLFSFLLRFVSLIPSSFPYHPRSRNRRSDVARATSHLAA